jgi:hypothetical protein
VRLLEELLAARANRQAVALITDLKTGEQRIVPRAQAAQTRWQRSWTRPSASTSRVPTKASSSTSTIRRSGS